MDKIELWSAATALTIDSKSQSQAGVSGQVLMEQAGLATAQWAMELWQAYSQILILAGPGNNGGDAFVAAFHLTLAGFHPRVIEIGSLLSKETPDRRRERLRWQALGKTPENYEQSGLALGSSHLMIIDGLYGLGLKGPLREGPSRQLLSELARHNPRLVLAIDLPSGAEADDWQPRDLPLAPTHIITFGALKLYHVLAKPSSQAVELRCVPLVFDAGIVSTTEDQAKLGLNQALAKQQSPLWAKLSPFAHKYQRGHICIIGGSPGKEGAPFLSGLAALRAGAGWVSIACSEEKAGPLSMTQENFYRQGQWDESAFLQFLKTRKVKAIVIGPGLIRNSLSHQLLEQLLSFQADYGLAIVFDAGSLHQWTRLAEGLKFSPKKTLLTPHPGEWLAIDAKHRPLESLEACEEALNFCQSFGVTLFYKSARPFTLCSEPRPMMRVVTQSNSMLAKAGSGDVLAGLAALALAEGREAEEAALMAQHLLLRSAEYWARQHNPHSMSAEDLAQGLSFV